MLLALSPLAARLSQLAPHCPIKMATAFPCPSCGTTRAAVALAHLDLAGALEVNPLAAAAWLGLVGGGLLAGLLAAMDRPLREPSWRLAAPWRWLLGLALLANWVYLVGAGV